MSKKYFGTDGIRGKVGVEPITADFILRMGRAVGLVLAGNDKRGVVIGKDTRLSCYMLENALVAGICSMGADVMLGKDPDCSRWIKQFREPAPEGATRGTGRRAGRRRRPAPAA